MDNSVQDLKMETEPIKKTQIERILEKENLGRQTGTTEAKFSIRLHEIEERISGIDYMTEEIDKPVKENTKSKNLLA